MARESGRFDTRGVGRRQVLRGSAAASAALAVPTLASAASAAPAQALSGRPSAQWGVQVGDVTT
ncbi:alkaline phosphatase, partial [Streptomyces sp. 2MCAF27]